MTSSLEIVENLLNEFYHPTTSNSRKRELENELTLFKYQPDSWHQCLGVISTDGQTNEYLWMFCSSTIEHAITHRWYLLSPTERTHLRENLSIRYANLPPDVVRRQRIMIAHLMAIMAKREFPTVHHAFIKYILDLATRSFQLGVTLLKTTSEEVMNSRDNVPSDVKDYFRAGVAMYMPEIIGMLGKYAAISLHHLNENTSSTFPININDQKMYLALPNDRYLSSSITLLLECIQHYFTWIAIDKFVPEYFLRTLFELSRWRKETQEISVAGLQAISELLFVQKPTPHPNAIMTSINGLLDKNNYVKAETLYDEKLTELLRLFTSKLSPKLLNEEVMVDRFLQLLDEYTFHSTETSVPFPEKLEVWIPLLKAYKSLRRPFPERIQLFVGKFIQHINNEIAQNKFDDSVNSDISNSEWQNHILKGIEVIALIAEQHPNQTFFQVYRLFFRPFSVILPVFERAVEISYTGSREKADIYFFKQLAQEVSMLCQILVCVAPLLNVATDDEPPELPINFYNLGKALVAAADVFSNKEVHIQPITDHLLRSNYNHLYNQCLTALRCLICVLPIMLSDDQLETLIRSTTQLFLYNPSNASNNVLIAAGQLLVTISSVISPKMTLEIQSVQQLLGAAPSLLYLPKDVVILLFKFMIGSLVLPWKYAGTQEQNFDQRCNALRQLIQRSSFNLLTTNIPVQIDAPEFWQLYNVSTGVLPIFTEAINHFSDACNTAKQMLASVFRPVISKTMSIIDVLGIENNPIVDVISEFALGVFKTLLNHLDISFVKDVIILYINCCTRGQMTTARLKATERILKMFEVIVKQPGSGTLCLLPSILSFTIDNILPLLHEGNNFVQYSEVGQNVYSLFDSALTYRWPYFYKGSVQSVILNGSSSNSDNENFHHTEQFLAIFNSYGQALVRSNDTNMTRTVLESLQNLNERWKLFQRGLFKTNLLADFQCTLIKVLFSVEGALHFDLLTNLLFAMGQVDKAKLHESFITMGVHADHTKAIEEICLITDIPTFSQKVSQLIQNANCLHRGH